MRAAVTFLSLLLVSGEVQKPLTRVVRKTNSSRVTERGIRDYQSGRFKDAAGQLREAARIAPDPRADFNVGTAEIAAGRLPEGAVALAGPVQTPSLRADALFNRGTGALQTEAFDDAIRDLEDVLRLRPADVTAKRNLEIALRKKASAQKRPQPESGAGSGRQAPQPSEPDRNEGEPGSAEEILRSVQQQEKEELSRMRRARRTPDAIGW